MKKPQTKKAPRNSFVLAMFMRYAGKCPPQERGKPRGGNRNTKQDFQDGRY